MYGHGLSALPHRSEWILVSLQRVVGLPHVTFNDSCHYFELAHKMVGYTSEDLQPTAPHWFILHNILLHWLDVHASVCMRIMRVSPLSMFCHHPSQPTKQAHGYQGGRSNHAQLSPIGCHHRRGQKKHPAHAYQCCFRRRIEWSAEIPLTLG